MKKSLVLAMAMALGVTASAYAANPFSDVPAGHWAYDSISKLAAAGVIEGYGDDTFRGDRLMTRYEMAQIVAKAMAKGANVDKLAAEFADELDALGVRVAALEKKADNVKFNGQIRYRWAEGSRVQGGNSRRRQSRLRSRIWLNGQVNDGWKYTAMFQNQQEFVNDIGEENTDWQRAFVTGRLGGVKVEAGRNQVDLIGGDSDVYSNRMDRVVLSYGDQVKVSGWYGKPTALNAAGGPATPNYGKGYGARLDYKMDKAGLYFEYDKLAHGNRPYVAGNNNTWDVWGIGADAKFGDIGVNALFLHGKVTDLQDYKKNGWTLNVAYKGANKAKPGTWGLSAKYYDQGYGTFAPGMHGTDAYLPVNAAGWTNGFKGFKLQADYTAAKNMVASVMYFDLKEKAKAAPGMNKAKARTALAQMVWTF